jgi:hypothetical protein
MIFCAATSTRTLRKRNDSMLHTREQTAENYNALAQTTILLKQRYRHNNTQGVRNFPRNPSGLSFRVVCFLSHPLLLFFHSPHFMVYTHAAHASCRCVSVGTRTGYSIYNCDPFARCFRANPGECEWAINRIVRLVRLVRPGEWAPCVASVLRVLPSMQFRIRRISLTLSLLPLPTHSLSALVHPTRQWPCIRWDPTHHDHISVAPPSHQAG